jgi:hypothetical protein
VAERFSCARTSWALEEPLLATASQVVRWVVVEQPGTWGADALRESALPGTVAEELLARCRRWRARPLLIRRAGGGDDGRRRVFVASSAPGGTWLRRFVVDDAAEVLDLDLDALAHDEPVGGEPMDGPLLLTCTNGRHDACCAEYGREVAAVLDEAFDDRAWECSHIGGDRFAANVLCLPEGVYYGRVTAAAAAGIGHLHGAGSLSLPHYRGRSVWPFDVQAAETLLRLHLGADGIDDVVPLGVDRAARGRADVELAVDGRRWRVELESGPDPTPQQLTCGASGTGHPPRYTARAMEPLDEVGAP